MTAIAASPPRRHTVGPGLRTLQTLQIGMGWFGETVTPGGVPEVVTDGETGVLVPPGDARAIGQALDALRRDPLRSAALARRASVHARQRFSRDAMLAGVRRVLEEVAA